MLLVRVPNWLGDLVMSMGALSGLSSSGGGAGFWAHKRVSGLLPVFFPDIPVTDSGVLPEAGRYDRLLLMTDSFSSAWAGYRSGIGVRIGNFGQFRAALLTVRLASPEGRKTHHSLDYDRLARAAGCQPTRVPVPRFDLEAQPHIAVFPGAAYGPAKRWSRFAEAATALSRRTGLEIVFYGSASEEARLGEIASAAGNGSSVAAGLPWKALCGRLACAELSLGNDSGGMHLSALLGIPSVVLFGSTSPCWTAPSGPRVAIVRSSAFPCSPCFAQRCPVSADGTAGCLEAIPVDEVLAAAGRLMAEEG